MNTLNDCEITENISVGREFIEWAEKYWHIDKILNQNNLDYFNSEVCDYKYIRDIFIQKIDAIISNRLA